MITLNPLSPDVAAKATPQDVLRWLGESIERSPCGHTLEEVCEEVRLGRAKLWVGRHSAAVTQFVPTERLWHAGADDGADLIRMMQAAADEMRRVGMERLIIEGTRKGWERVLRPHGFEKFSGLALDL